MSREEYEGWLGIILVLIYFSFFTSFWCWALTKHGPSQVEGELELLI